MIGTMPRSEPAVTRWVRRFCIALAAAYLILAGWGFVRRIRQILRIELNTSASILAPGATVSYDVIASGETRDRIRLELVQGAHAETLDEQLSDINRYNTIDPRVFRYQRTVTMTPELLSRFAAGAATLRLTGFGGQKLLRTPAPRVRELVVELKPATK